MNTTPERPSPIERLEDGLEALDARVAAAIVPAKPNLRALLHAAMAPLSLVAAIVLIVLSRTTVAKVSAAVFGVTSVLLFATSAVYHLSLIHI